VTRNRHLLYSKKIKLNLKIRYNENCTYLITDDNNYIENEKKVSVFYISIYIVRFTKSNKI
jgi:hypothetical protein